MNNLFTADYQKIFPENLKKYKNLRTLAKEFEKNFKNNIVTEIEKLAIYKNLEIQSDEILSQLAWQYVIDNWQETLSREVKINLIKNAYWAHATKGTKIAIIDNLKKLNYPITVQEWFEYGGKPFTFKLIINHINNDTDWINILINIVNKYKNSRSILEAVNINLNKTHKIKVFSYKTRVIERKFVGLQYYRINKKTLQNVSYKVIKMEVK